MNLSYYLFCRMRNIRPTTAQGDASWGFSVRGIDHAVGLTTLGLIFAIWMAVLAFV